MRPIVPLLLLVVSLPSAACTPLVSHGPRVQPGLWSGTTGGLGIGPGLEAEVETPLGGYPVRTSNGWFARYGFTGEGAPVEGVLIGVHLPWAIPLSIVHPELDVYGQYTHSSSPVQAGSGLLASPSYLMPYAQLGVDIGNSELYTTQGLAIFGYQGDAPDALLWMPTLTLRRRPTPDPEAPERPRPSTHYFVQFMTGRERGLEDGDRRVRRLILGISREAPGFFGLGGAPQAPAVP